MAEPIEMPFGLRILVGPRNHALDWDPHPPMGRGNFEGEGAVHCTAQGHSVVACAKTAELILMPFGLWAHRRPRKYELDGDPELPMRRGNYGER